MTQNPLLSIVTVTYNDPHGVTRTLQSLRALAEAAASEIEIIVIDGGSQRSADSTGPIVPESITFVSEPDEGIYDAMNKGLRLSRGSHIWFLNGGDESCINSWAMLRAELLAQSRSMIFGNYVLDTGRERISRKSRNSTYIWHGLPTSHQAIFYPGVATRRAGYDTTYRIVADYELTARMIVNGVRCHNWNQAVAVFHTGGASHVNARGVAREAALVQTQILGRGPVSRAASQLRHAFSRNVRAFQARPSSQRDAR